MLRDDPVYASVGAFVETLRRAGVRHACVSPGARSTALVLTLANTGGVRAWSHIDERSGAFFALGMSKATRRPVAVVCTSGTAAANFFPAVVEAAHAHVPLLILTADRPPELRDCGAPQTIDQIKLYGSYVKWFAEAGDPCGGERYFSSLASRALAAAVETPAGPVHVNFAFREPLLPRAAVPSVREADREGDGQRSRVTTFHPAVAMPAPATLERLAEMLSAARRGLIVCGPQDAASELAVAVTRLAARRALPILAEPLSQLRCGAHDTGAVAAHADAFLRAAPVAAALAPDVVVRIGAMPTSKPFLHYLRRHPDCRQIVLDPTGGWNDPTLAASELVRGDPATICTALADRLATVPAGAPWLESWQRAERAAVGVFERELAGLREPFAGKVIADMAAVVPDGTLVYTGSSMPVRDLDGFWPAGSRRVRFLANRGANGIDGFVSSGLGAAAVSDGPLLMVTGDLGFYHDLNGLLAVRRHGVRATIVVLNNNGGGIFDFLPQADCGSAFEEFFTTPHGLDFRGAVEMYGAKFERVTDAGCFRTAVRQALSAPETTVIEVPVDRARNVALHRQLWTAAGEAARRAVCGTA